MWYFTSLGFGAHFGCFPMSQAIVLFKNGLALDISFLLSLGFSRASVGLLLIRLFAIRKTARYSIWALVIFQGLVAILTIAIISPRCDPIEKLWDPSVPGTCFSAEAVTAVLYLNGAVSIFSDFVLALSPIYVLWNIQMSTRNKATVCVLLGLGFIPAASAFARTIYGCRTQTSDPTYTNAWNAFAITIEACFVIISGSIPILRSFFTLRRPSMPISTPKDSSQRKLNSHYARISTPRRSGSQEVSTDMSQPPTGQQNSSSTHKPTMPLGTYKAFGHATASGKGEDVENLADGQIAKRVDMYVV